MSREKCAAKRRGIIWRKGGTNNVEDIGEEEEIWEEFRWVQGETQTQWTSTEEEREIGHATIVGSLATWPRIVGRGIKRE